jgi:hypothetical protein
MRYKDIVPVRYIQTPVISNVPAEPITQVRNVPVVPDAVKHQRWQQAKAAEIARSNSQIQPTKQDLAMAFMRYGKAQSQAKKNWNSSNA